MRGARFNRIRAPNLGSDMAISRPSINYIEVRRLTLLAKLSGAFEGASCATRGVADAAYLLGGLTFMN